MKKIAYIELDTHAEIAQNFMDLMDDSKEFEVDYYFSERIYKQIGRHNSNVFLIEIKVVLNQLDLKKYELIIIGTAHRYFDLFKEIARKFNTSIIVHNQNFTKISRFQLVKNIFKKDIKYRLKLWLKEDLLSVPEVFKSANNLLVLDESLVKNELKYLPVFFNQYQVKNYSEIFTIVIPGAVSQARRDYDKVFMEILNLENRIKNGFNFEENLIEFVFLGKAKEQQLKKITELECSLEYINITYFTEKVPQKNFDNYMNKANVLWCPIQSITEFFSNEEMYGKTKMSGSIGDAIKYGKMAVFPEEFPNSLPFIIPEIDDIQKQLLIIKSQDKYNFQEKFNKEKILENLENILKTLM